MKFKEFEKKTEQELLDLINDLRAELFTLRFKNKTQQQDQTHKIKLVRRDIAKALTAIKQKQTNFIVSENKNEEKISTTNTKTKKQVKSNEEKISTKQKGDK